MSDDEQRKPIPSQAEATADAGGPDADAAGTPQPPEPAAPGQPPAAPGGDAEQAAHAEPAGEATASAASGTGDDAPDAEPEAGAGAGGRAGGADAGEEPGQRPRPARSRQKVSAAGAFIGVLLGLLGFALAVQLRSNAGDAQLTNERPEDLVQILSDLDSRQERLRLEITNLQSTKQQLQAGTQSREAALQAATQRANELGILAGTLAAQGPGLVIRVQPGRDHAVKAETILDMVEELRNAGAEAMQIEGAGGSVRIVASTYFIDTDSGRLEVDGRQLAAPYTLTVIGAPQNLQPALNIAGGVVDVIRNDGGTVTVSTPATVTVSALTTVTTPKYAKPTK
jgi:uncharacterized protein YlxW (UPF0749 family)